jgi:hypothetical protein
MKKIRNKDIDPNKLITKSQYARDFGLSPTAVQNKINRGELTIVVAKGGELIHL